MTRPPSRRRTAVLVSAHRFGAGADRTRENSLPALERSLSLGVDYVEFDVRRGPGGRLVVAHDAAQADERAPAYDEVLAAIAGRARAHIDLKLTLRDQPFDPELRAEIDATRLAVERLGTDQLIVTIGNAEAVRAVRDWADAERHDLLVGLSLGRWNELFARIRIRRSRANLIVAHWLLARLGLAWYARRRGTPLLVWTVDPAPRLRYWLRPGRAWMVTTNFPERALAIRDDGGGASSSA
jgi:glycerophosphoryl diester phosphodiesterase